MPVACREVRPVHPHRRRLARRRSLAHCHGRSVYGFDRAGARPDQRLLPRAARVSRPGFNYGFGPEALAGRALDPGRSYVAGQVPLLKLHGSVSWSVERGELVKYHDCRPAIRGDPAIVAPIVGKTVPHYLRQTWRVAGSCLVSASTWIVIGYSLPTYDQLVRELLLAAATPATTVHVLDPDPAAAQRFQALLPKADVHAHAGLPGGTEAVRAVLVGANRPAEPAIAQRLGIQKAQ